jgi:phosphoribosyl 1,2-cyclic phosphodiesterase
MTEAPFLVRIWGARGSLPGPAAPNCKYGSESPCVEMRCGDHILIFDAGSGIEGLSAKLREEGALDLDIFFSHCHFDHIMGLPFLRTLYEADANVRIYAGHFLDRMTCREMVERFMAPPYFPITPKYFCAQIDYRDFHPTDTLAPQEGITIPTVRLNHPNGCVGYRVEHAGRTVCYMTDVEHIPGKPDPALLEAIRGADILIYDCTYTDAEFDHYVGYGHSTWEEGVRICEAAGVKRLVLFHHRIGRTDEDLQRIENEAQARFPGAIVARTGLELTP